MILSIGLIVLGILLLTIGGEILLRGAVALALLFRLTPTVIGLTIVAAGTSIPELAVGVTAVYQGNVDIAVANVIGSNHFNIPVILGLCAVIRPFAIAGNTLKLEYPILVLVTLLCLVITQDGEINRLDATLCLTIYIGFMAYLVSLVREQATASESQELQTEVAELAPSSGRPRFQVAFGLVMAGSILLALGARATVTGAVEIARALGWSERVIGLTIVSAGTGLPEVVASAVASIRGRSDIAIGNVIGSNLFNILCVLGVTAMIAPLPVQAELIARDNWWMLGVTLLLFPMILNGSRLHRWEGVALLMFYGVYLWLLLSAQPTPS